MFIAASTKNVSDMGLSEGLNLLTDLAFDKVELYCNESANDLKPSVIAADPARFISQFRDMTRLTPVAFDLVGDIDAQIIMGIAMIAKQMRITQISISASPLGTPFNSEIDRLREMVAITNRESVLLSLRTENGTLTQDPHTAVELCQAVQGLGLTLDPSYYMCHPEGAQSYEQVYPYVYHAHFRDSTNDNFQVPVGLGENDFSHIMGQLKRENYQRSLSVDFDPQLIEEGTRQIELRKLRMFLESLIE